jgi:hypothetical protein
VVTVATGPGTCSVSRSPHSSSMTIAAARLRPASNSFALAVK